MGGWLLQGGVSPKSSSPLPASLERALGSSFPASTPRRAGCCLPGHPGARVRHQHPWALPPAPRELPLEVERVEGAEHPAPLS